MFFKDWRECSQDILPLNLNKKRFYYIQAQACYLKGYFGGTHSYCTFWDRNYKKWLVIEKTKMETLLHQNCDVVYCGIDSKELNNPMPYISTRIPNAQWFGHNPYVVDSCINTIQLKELIEVCKEYPYKEFNLLTRNCNTFTSFLIWKLNLKLKKPFKSFGFKTKSHWKKYYDI
jgi:hypothetical protein